MLLAILNVSSASAISFGCKKAQSEASSYLSSALSLRDSELVDMNRGRYDNAFSSFQYANRFYTSWLKTVNKSPKCFSSSYVLMNKSKLKSVSVNQSMQSRYGADIASRFNYGSPDPCFKYLGQDNAYLECSMRNY